MENKSNLPGGVGNDASERYNAEIIGAEFIYGKE
jgi:hypothetical protein